MLYLQISSYKKRSFNVVFCLLLNRIVVKIISEDIMAERISYVLACTVCKDKNYHYSRGKKKEYKVEVSKFCKKCGKHTVHKEGKV